MRLIKQLLVVFAVLTVLAGALLLFTYDIVKVQWVTFMGIQPSFTNMEQPLPVPSHSIPIEGAAYIPGMGAPENPVAADESSIARGAQLYALHCQMCHGVKYDGRGPVGNLLRPFLPANLTLPVIQSKSDGSLFLTITLGVNGRMPALNENLTVRERWDVVNFLRTIAAPITTP